MACTKPFSIGSFRFELDRSTYLTKESVEAVACGISGRVNVWKVYHQNVFAGIIYVKPWYSRSWLVQAARVQLNLQA